MPAQYGLIGYPLTHSFSPAYFKKKFAQNQIYARYDAFPLASIQELNELLLAYPDMAGLNVTIPYKAAVIPLLDQIDSVAAEINAVNCISFSKGKKIGYNTDATGFAQSLNPLLHSQHTRALILGTGGSSKAVAYVLSQLGIGFQKVSRIKREGMITYEEITGDVMKQSKLIINTTPAGMYPNVDTFPPIPYELLGKGHLLYDLVYNPDETRFLAKGRDKGAVIKNGFEMLQLQADASWEIWNHVFKGNT